MQLRNVIRSWGWSATWLTCLFAPFRASSQDCFPPPTGLVAWWPGEGTANDFAGTNNGELRGGVTFTNGVAGRGFRFDGISGTVDVPDSSSLELTAQLTVEAWINPLVINGDQGIVSKISAATGLNGYQLALRNGNELSGQFNSPGLDWPHWLVQYPLPMVPGEWYHVAWTYDQSAMVLYFNGQPVATNLIGPQPIATSSADLRISGTDDHVYFNGEIDEASVYHTALSAAQILAIYNAGSAGKCARPFITSQPRSQVGNWGSTIAFSAVAAGSPPLSYQWLLDNTNISAATNPTATNAMLVLTSLPLNAGGAYSLVVSNAYGSAISSNAYLSVNSAGVSIATYAGLTVSGVVGLTYGIQYNTDLNNTNGWHGAANLTLGQPIELWFDVQPANQPQRYYRVVPGPISIP